MAGRSIHAAETMLELRAGRAVVDLVPAIGGSIATFRWNADDRSIDWLRPATAAALGRGDPEGMACFPLVPYSNRIRAGRFTFDGQTIQLPTRAGADPHCEHGLGWRSAWTVVAADMTSAALQYRHSADAWPWPYLAEQRFAVSINDLSVGLALTNLSDRPMPCGLGLHPYFPRSAGTTLTAAVTAMWATDADVLPHHLIPPPTEGDPRMGLPVSTAALDNAFIGWNGDAEIRHPALRIEAASPLRVLVVYTPPDEDFFCVEPVSNVTDAFNLAAAGRPDTGLVVLPPGETLRTSVRFIPCPTLA